MNEHTRRGRSKQRSSRQNAPTFNHGSRLSHERQTCVQIPLFIDDCPGCHLRRLAAPTNVPEGQSLPLLLCALHDPQARNSG